MQKSDSIKNIGAALLIFDNEMSKIGKSATNPFFKNKYAPLPDILAAIKEPLATAGLTVKQFPEDEHYMTTMLIHPESGEWISTSYKMRPAKDDPQGEGSRITYQRRYALGSVLGLNIDVDDDGNKASEPSIFKEPVKSSDDNPWLSDKQLEAALLRIKAKDFGASQTAKEFVDKLYGNFKVNKEFRQKLADAVIDSN